MCDTPAIRVEEWNGVQLDGAVFDVKSQTNVLRMKVNISVREHYTFGIGARAAGIEKLGQRVFVDGSDVGAMRGGPPGEIFVSCVEKAMAFLERPQVGRMFLLQEYPCEKTRPSRETVSQQRGLSPRNHSECSPIRMTRAGYSAGAERHRLPARRSRLEQAVAIELRKATRSPRGHRPGAGHLQDAGRGRRNCP